MGGACGETTQEKDAVFLNRRRNASKRVWCEAEDQVRIL